MRRVLVIDDHEPSRKHLITILREGRCEIAGEGASGKLVAAMARSAAPEVVCMAVGLSDMDGIDATRRLMRLQPLPVVLTSSHYDAATVERAKQAGAMAFLVKPLRAAEVMPTIELAISRFHDFLSLRQENSSLRENLAARKWIERAKGLLMEQRKLTEEQAYALMKKTSMNLRKPMVEIAQAIVLAGGVRKDDEG
ncbi:MAG TPA: ANTAR domain-containing protein [Candidatus Binatia bacterium]|jgi:AmiR/NasT family two-component response regulator|nr:ANTAR domain-containing protein [Candidatus Binatia bacterium]